MSTEVNQIWKGSPHMLDVILMNEIAAGASRRSERFQVQNFQRGGQRVTQEASFPLRDSSGSLSFFLSSRQLATQSEPWFLARNFAVCISLKQIDFSILNVNCEFELFELTL